MQNKNLLLIAFICFTSLMSGQPTYLVGVGQQSLEPDKSTISLALSGYAAPGEGRFTLQWLKLETLPAVTAICGVSDRLYIISKGEVLWKHVSDKTGWKKAGNSENLITITGTNNKMYAINNHAELLETNINKIKWTKISSVDKSVNSLTISGNKLFAANNTGDLWSANLAERDLNWSELNAINGIISLASINEDLYVLTDDGIIYLSEPESDIKWLKIAYKNDITIKEDIRSITITDNIIYGVSRDNILYEGEHRSEGNLSARAMAIKINDRIVVIMNIDLVGLTDQYIGMLKEDIYRKHKIPSSAVLINISHTHFAPVVQDWPTWAEHNQHPNKTYLYSTVKKGILGAVDKSLDSMAPAQLYFGRGKTDIGYNRSLSDHPELYDNSVDVLKVIYSDKTENYMFLASCHAVFGTAGKSHYTISANFPGIARKLLEERTNTSNSLFLQGTAGDINPRDHGEYITGEKLSNEVISVLNSPMTEITGEITFFLDTLNIPVQPWTKEELLEFKTKNSGRLNDLGAEKNVKWANVMLKKYEDGNMPVSNPVYVHTLNIGNWKLVGFSRETTSAYALGVKEMWPDKLVSVVGYTNDVSSYLPTNMHVEKHNYEGLDSFFWYGAIPFSMSVDELVMQKINSLKR